MRLFHFESSSLYGSFGRYLAIELNINRNRKIAEVIFLTLLLDKGKVVEQGTHCELIARKGAYYQLVQKQMSV